MTTDTPLPQCRCGTTRNDERSSPEREYSMMGAIYLLWGGTAVPTQVNFRCARCGDIFDRAKDKATLRRHVL